MKVIELSNCNDVTIVDNDMFKKLNQFKWRKDAQGYACRKKNDYMHYHVIGHPPDGLQTDHISRNKLDNRRCNLRFVTTSQNQANKPKQKNNTSGYKGVRLHHKKYVAASRIGVSGGRKKHLGRFTSKIAAAIAYDNYVGSIYPGIAYQNFPNTIKRTSLYKWLWDRGTDTVDITFIKRHCQVERTITCCFMFKPKPKKTPKSLWGKGVILVYDLVANCFKAIGLETIVAVEHKGLLYRVI